MLKNITLAKKYWKVPWYYGNMDNIQIYIKIHIVYYFPVLFLQVKYVFRHVKCISMVVAWYISISFCCVVL